MYVSCRFSGAQNKKTGMYLFFVKLIFDHFSGRSVEVYY